MSELLIKGGKVCDGTGRDAFLADVVISDGRIADIIPWESEAARPSNAEVIDASGKVVTPGFVDVHSHSDYHALVEPNCDSKLFQGITTEIVGNCGMSAFPLLGEMYEEDARNQSKVGLRLDWNSAAEYFAKVDEVRPALNYASFVGHGNIRGSVVGYQDRPATTKEMAAMEAEVAAAMDAGALGISTGLIYAPGFFADTDEIVQLQRVAARKGGIYASHVRGEGDHLVEAAEEFSEVVQKAECQGQYSHLKASGRRNWGKVEQVIEMFENINSHGGLVRFDKYPYIASATDLSSFLPRWVRDGGREAALARLIDPIQKKQLQQELADDFGEYSPWPGILVVWAGSEEFRRFNGRTVEQIGQETETPPQDVFIELLIASGLSTSICNFTMNQEETDMAILHPWGMVCTDAEIHTESGVLAQGSPHPRAYGSFPRYFRQYALDTKRLTLEQAVAKVTNLPCETFGFSQRGRIEKGYHADLLVIDMENLRDKSTFEDPHHYSEGVETVVVNGVLTLRDGKFTGNRGGGALRKK